MKTITLSSFAGLLLSVVAANLPAATTVFHYRVNETDEAGLPTIPSVEGPDGIAGPEVVLSEDIPTDGVPAGAGNRSIDTGGFDGVNSADIRELDNFFIADEGGFTFEAWFKWLGGGDINPVLDYAGTEKLVIDINQGSGNELRMRINSNGGLDSFIAEVEMDEWYYSAVVFDTLGNEVAPDNSITGIFRLYLDGELVDETDEVTITEFGDTLNRSIGVSKHPEGFARDFFDGLVYEPRVSLGALTASELLFPAQSSVVGDYNGNGELDTGDLDLQAIEMTNGNHDPGFDLTEDGLVNFDDRKMWVEQLKNTWIGDADLDGEFNSGDMVGVFVQGKYETGAAAGWTDGDWNGDLVFTSSDMVAAFAGGGYEQGARPALSAVPEPSSVVLLALAASLLVTCLRRR